jgi:hypothetical protein
MSDLEIIAQIDEKIHQLPAEVLAEVDDYVSFLLQKYHVKKIRKSVAEITDADIDAVCGVYRAERSVSLEQMEAAIMQGALDGCR